MKRARQYFSDFNKFCLPVLSAFYSTPHPIGKCSAGNIGKQHSKWKCMNQNQTPTPPSEYAVSESPSVWSPGEKMNRTHRIKGADKTTLIVKSCYPGRSTPATATGQNCGPAQYGTGTKWGVKKCCQQSQHYQASRRNNRTEPDQIVQPGDSAGSTIQGYVIAQNQA